MLWSEHIREDLKNIPDMVDLGFSVEFKPEDMRAGRTSPDNVPHFDVSFRLDQGVNGKTAYLHVWRIREGWQTAQVIDNRYGNHLSFLDLERFLIEFKRDKEFFKYENKSNTCI